MASCSPILGNTYSKRCDFTPCDLVHIPISPMMPYHGMPFLVGSPNTWTHRLVGPRPIIADRSVLMRKMRCLIGAGMKDARYLGHFTISFRPCSTFYYPTNRIGLFRRKISDLRINRILISILDLNFASVQPDKVSFPVFPKSG